MEAGADRQSHRPPLRGGTHVRDRRTLVGGNCSSDDGISNHCRELVAALRDALTGGQAATVIAPLPAEAAATHRVRTGLIAVGALLLMGAEALAAELTSGNGGAAAKPPPQRTVTVTVTAPARRPATSAASGSAANGGLQTANADWQLATALARLGRCKDALPLVDRAQVIAGDQPRDQLRALCTGPPGRRPGHHGHH